MLKNTFFYHYLDYIITQILSIILTHFPKRSLLSWYTYFSPLCQVAMIDWSKKKKCSQQKYISRIAPPLSLYPYFIYFCFILDGLVFFLFSFFFLTLFLFLNFPFMSGQKRGYWIFFFLCPYISTPHHGNWIFPIYISIWNVHHDSQFNSFVYNLLNRVMLV